MNVQRKHCQKRSQHTQQISSIQFFWRPSEKRTKKRKPIYVFDNCKWIREEAVVDSGAVVCDGQEKKCRTWEQWRCQSHDQEKRGHAQEEMRSRPPSKRQLADRFGHHEARFIQSPTSVEKADQCGQTP